MKGFQMLLITISIMILIVVSIWIYSIFSEVLLENFIPQMEIHLNETGQNNTNVNDVITLTKSTWINWILMFVLGLIVVMFIYASKKEYIPGYG